LAKLIAAASARRANSFLIGEMAGIICGNYYLTPARDRPFIQGQLNNHDCPAQFGLSAISSFFTACAVQFA
jgi:hypothetical protein